MECGSFCRLEKAILISSHISGFGPEMLAHSDALFGSHLGLRVEGFTHGVQMKTMNVVDVAQVNGTNLLRETSIHS